MWHIYRNSEGKFEFAFISKGEYVAGTRQGYERRSKALKSLHSLGGLPFLKVQDDTGDCSVIITIDTDMKQLVSKDKPGKPYKG